MKRLSVSLASSQMSINNQSGQSRGELEETQDDCNPSCPGELIPTLLSQPYSMSMCANLFCAVALHVSARAARVIDQSHVCVCVCVCTTGSPADGILYPGDQVLQINEKVMEDLSAEQVENILR